MTALNRFQSYFDPKTKEGIYLYNSVFNNFKCPLAKEELIKFDPNNVQSFIAVVTRLACQYGYNFMVQNLPTSCLKIPGLAEGDAPIIMYAEQIYILKEYSVKNIVRAPRYASLVGDNQYHW